MTFNSKAILFLLSIPVGLMGIVQIIFALLSLFVFHDHEETLFLEADLVLFIAAIFLAFFARGFDTSRIGFRESLLFATMTWIIMGLLGAIPIILVTHVSFTDGVFESISALTTTGATILTGLDSMPKTFLLYRQFLQWLGGLGVVIFVVSVLPMLNIGGMKLLRAETPGPVKDDKLTPRVVHTAHYLWVVYVSITVLCAVGYSLAGMNTFDAIAHSLTTVSTGGFSTHDASLGYFHSPNILLVSDVFMILGAISFALHYRVFHLRSLRTYWRDEETRVFLLLIVILSIIVTVALIKNGTYTSLPTALNEAAFHLISFITSTGYGAGDFTHWPIFIVFLLVVASYIGGCAGSTAGGNKVIRDILTIKILGRELNRLIHPSGVFTLKYQRHPVEDKVLEAAIAFMSITACTSLAFTLLLMMTGLDFWSSLTAVAACINVLGPAFGELGNNFQPVSDFGTWVLSLAMILGRLEYFTVLAVLLPSFWRY